MAKDGDITLRELVRDNINLNQQLNAKINELCGKFSRIDEALNGKFGVVFQVQENTVEIKNTKANHFKLENDYKSDRAKIYGIASGISFIFASLISFLKDLIFKTQ